MPKEIKNKKGFAINIAIALFLVAIISFVVYASNIISALQFQNYVANVANVSFFNVTTILYVPWYELFLMFWYFTFPTVLAIMILTYFIIKNYHKNHILKKNLFVFLILTTILFIVLMISAQYYMVYYHSWLWSYPNMDIYLFEPFIMQPVNQSFIGIPYNNTYVYFEKTFILSLPKGYSKVLEIPNNSIVSFIFNIHNCFNNNYCKELNKGPVHSWLDFKWDEAFPTITIKYYVIRNGLNYTFNIYNQTNYNYYVTRNDLANLYLSTTLGILYNNKIYVDNWFNEIN
ncbi:MAG: hypothetical protein QXO65_03330 [Candidatus Aenigmatarchaeota archaeon]